MAELMRVLVVNAGSSSLKLRLLGEHDEVLEDQLLDPWDGDAAALASFLAAAGPVDAVGHRVVHGGLAMRSATVIDDDVVTRIEALAPLAPLHQQRALAGIRAAAGVLGDVPAVACFDTAYHATLPPAAATYALPLAWRERWPLRRFGFHGLSHGYAARRTAELLGDADQGLRLVTCHLGAGASLCASIGGTSVETTMGFSPLEGLVMQTRCGTIDPGLVLWLLTEAGMPAASVAEGLEAQSGLAGLAGGTGDMRDVLARRQHADTRALLAFDVYMQRLAQGVAAMTVALGQLDALVFTGGVGEHSPEVRQAAADRLAFLGMTLDEAANTRLDGSDRDISASASGVRVLVVEAREDLEIAQQTRAALRAA